MVDLLVIGHPDVSSVGVGDLLQSDGVDHIDHGPQGIHLLLEPGPITYNILSLKLKEIILNIQSKK